MELSPIKELASLKPDKYLGISLFLNINAKERRHSDIKTILNHLIEQEEQNLAVDHYRHKDLRVDIEKVRSYFESEDFVQGDHRGIAVFSNFAKGVFKVFYLAQPIEDRIFFSNIFLIRPLLGYLDKFSKYLAVLVDQSRARFFEMEQGAKTDYSYFRDVVPSKVREGGWYGYEEHHIERHVEDHLHQHYKKVARKTLNMLRKHDYRWLMLVGQAETLSAFKKTLHPYCMEKLAGEITADIAKRTEGEIMERIFTKARTVKEQMHKELFRELNEKYPHRAAMGIKDVKRALDRKAVHKLIFGDNLVSVFPTCNKCDYRLHDTLICPKCHTDLTVLDFEANSLAVKALNQNSKIHFLDSDMLKDKGVGAILRF